MKKYLGILFLAILLLSGCSSNEANSLEQIKKSGKLVVGTNAGYPPYEFYAIVDGKRTLTGVDIKLAEMIAEDLGVELVIENMDFDALVPSLQANKFDLILAGMVNTPKREKVIDFTIAYNDAKTVAVTKNENVEKLTGVKNLNGKTIVVQTATTQVDAANNVEGAKVLALPSVPDGVLHVLTDKADVLFIAEISAKKIIEANPGLSYYEIDMDKSFLEDGASMGVSKGNKELKEYLDKKIDEWKKDGTIDELIQEFSVLESVE